MVHILYILCYISSVQKNVGDGPRAGRSGRRGERIMHLEALVTWLFVGLAGRRAAPRPAPPAPARRGFPPPAPLPPLPPALGVRGAAPAPPPRGRPGIANDPPPPPPAGGGRAPHA